MTHRTESALRNYLRGFARHDPRPLRAIATACAASGDPNTWWREEALAAIRGRLRDLVAVFEPDLLLDLVEGRIDATAVVSDVLAEARRL